MVTQKPAHALGLADYGVHGGAAADLVVIDTATLHTVVTMITPRLATFKGGKLVVRTEISRQWTVGQ